MGYSSVSFENVEPYDPNDANTKRFAELVIRSAAESEREHVQLLCLKQEEEGEDEQRLIENE